MDSLKRIVSDAVYQLIRDKLHEESTHFIVEVSRTDNLNTQIRVKSKTEGTMMPRYFNVKVSEML